jgi:hypothetical protein
VCLDDPNKMIDSADTASRRVVCYYLTSDQSLALGEKRPTPVNSFIRPRLVMDSSRFGAFGLENVFVQYDGGESLG